MKFFNTFKYFLALALIAGIFTFNSCDPEEEPQHLYLKFHQHVGEDELELNQPFTSDSGVKFTVSRIKYYLSGLKLQISHAGEYKYFDGVYLLVDENTDQIDLGEIEAGEKHGLEFSIGIEDSAVNHSDPGSYESTSPLAPQSPSMNWGWSTGYKFFVLEGMVDTDNDGTVDAPMQLHIGGDENLAHHDSHHHFDIIEGQDLILNVELNLLEALKGVDLATQYVTHSDDGDTLATHIAANLSGDAFLVE